MRLTDHPAFARSFAAAQEAGFPLLLGPVAKSAPHNTSPYACSYERFEAEFFGTERRRDIGLALNDCLQSAAAGDVQVSAMMVGGSFIDARVGEPRDLDALVFYQTVSDDGVAHLRTLQAAGKAKRLDLRFAPLDSEPLLLIKSVAFFTILYSSQRSEAQPRRGTLLVEF